MSSCLSRGTGRAYGINLETIVKSSSSSSLSSASSSITSNSSSPSSSLSESSNSTLAVIAVTTRKPRTPRKRPNQTYIEAANLLSTACPTIFSTNTITSKLPKSPNQQSSFFTEPPELARPIKTKQREIEFNRSLNQSPNSSSLKESNAYQHDFFTESILDEEIAKGIDSIIGKSNSITQCFEISGENPCFSSDSDFNFNHNYSKNCYGYPVELGFGGNLEINYGFGLKNGVRASKNVDDRNWSFPATNVMNVSPMKKKTKVLVEELMMSESENLIFGDEGLLKLKLKLNYDGVLKAWSEKGLPVPEVISGVESPGSDVNKSLAHVDLFLENEWARKASVIRYKEKRRTRFFSRKIRYQVRKVNVDRRPRYKGRFVRRPSSPTWEET